MSTDGAHRFKSIKSLPVDYRFMGSTDKSASSNSSMISDTIPENGSAAGGGNIDQVDDDSPYAQSSTLLMNGRPSVDDEDINPSVSPQGTVLPSWGETKWGDTASYVAKKPHFWLNLNSGDSEISSRHSWNWHFLSVRENGGAFQDQKVEVCMRDFIVISCGPHGVFQ